MKLTRERKIFGGVLCAAVLAMGVNQLIPGAEAESPDDYAVTPGSPGTPGASAAPTPAARAAADALGAAPTAAASFSIAEQLSVFQGKNGYATDKVKDAFAPSWRAQVLAEVEKKKEGPTQAEITAQFQQTHTLTAVMTAGNSGGFAMIKGVPIAVGKTVDGFKLVSVTQRTATFQSPEGSPVILTLTQVAQAADAAR